MTEEELQQKRQEFRDSELQKKIDNFEEDVNSPSTGSSKKSVQNNNNVKRVSKKDIGKFAWAIIISHATGIIFFSTLFVMTYIPKTKFIVTKIMP